MKQIIIRMIVALTMCGVTSLVRFTSFIVIPRTPQVHTESIWILRLILASVLSPVLYSLLDKHTSTWAIRAKNKVHRYDGSSVLSIAPSAFDLINPPAPQAAAPSQEICGRTGAKPKGSACWFEIPGRKAQST